MCVCVRIFVVEGDAANLVHTDNVVKSEEKKTLRRGNGGLCLLSRAAGCCDLMASRWCSSFGLFFFVIYLYHK